MAERRHQHASRLSGGQQQILMLRTLSGLRVFPILKGVRGEAPVDLDAVCGLVEAVGRSMTDEAAGVSSFDINPGRALDPGRGCVAADGVVVGNEAPATEQNP